MGDKKQLAMGDYELRLLSKAKNINEGNYKRPKEAFIVFQQMVLKTWCEKCVNEFNN